MSVRLYLIRHGETEWSLTGQHTGRTDIPLTPRGEKAARELAPGLKGIAFSHVLTSPLQRAWKTCDLAGLGAAATVEPDLAEWDYGDYEGKRSVDIRKQRPDWNVFRDGCPGGESVTQISERADRPSIAKSPNLVPNWHFVQAELKHFEYDRLEEALAWASVSTPAGAHVPDSHYANKGR